MACGLNQERLIRSCVVKSARGNDSVVKSASNIAAARRRISSPSGLASPAHAVTEIHWWHAMSGELRRASKNSPPISTPRRAEYRIVPAYKGHYTETVTASIFAFRSRRQPAIVQVNEIATATMMAAQGAIYPVFELMREQGEAFRPCAYLPAVTGYYTDVAGNMLSFPFNASTPILYYNKDLFRAAGLDPTLAPKTWPEVGAAAKKLLAAGAPCGFTTSWPSWINVENLSAFHNVPIATRLERLRRARCRARPSTTRSRCVTSAARGMAEHQGLRLIAAARSADAALPGASAASSSARRRRAPTSRRMRNSRSATACCRIGPTCGRAAEHHHRRRHAVGAARPAGRRIPGVAKFFAFLSQPEVQAPWHQGDRLSAGHARRLRAERARRASTTAIRAPRSRSSRSP